MALLQGSRCRLTKFGDVHRNIGDWCAIRADSRRPALELLEQASPTGALRVYALSSTVQRGVLRVHVSNPAHCQRSTATRNYARYLSMSTPTSLADVLQVVASLVNAQLESLRFLARGPLERYPDVVLRDHVAHDLQIFTRGRCTVI